MSYEVSGKVKDLLAKITALDEVQEALKFIEDDADNTLEEQIMLCKIEAPTFQEAERAEAYKNILAGLGLSNPHLDRWGSAVATMKGTGGGPKVLNEAHLDTVFPLGSVKDVKIENGLVHAPGIVDDTRGLVVATSTVRAFNHSGIKTKGDVVFAGIVEEEGMGGLGGMKKYLDDNPDIEASISIDGSDAYGVIYEATGIRTCEANFYGIGGHAYGAFAAMANPLHAAARAVAKIADFQVPEEPRTTFCVSNFHAGNDAGIHAIVPKATIKFNYRSNSMDELNKLTAMIDKACKEACEEETARWGKDTITYDMKYLVDVMAGTQDTHAPIVESLVAIIEHLEYEPYWIRGGSTNANNAIGKGIPAVCIGIGKSDNKVHTLDEFFNTKNAHHLVQVNFLLVLMLAGIEGKTEPVLNL